MADGAEAVAALQQRAYDLVLMDIQMPVMDGVQATRQIRALGGAAANVPVIALTANVYAEQVARFREAGMTDHIGKPVQRSKLLETVDRWLRNAAPNVTAIDPPIASEPAVDLEVQNQLADVMGGAGLSKLLARFEQQLLESALSEQLGRQQIATRAHKLVSSAGMLGFRRLSTLCASLEQACLGDDDIAHLIGEVGKARQEVLLQLSNLTQAA